MNHAEPAAVCSWGKQPSSLGPPPPPLPRPPPAGNSGSRRDAEEILYHMLPKGITVFALDFAASAPGSCALRGHLHHSMRSRAAEPHAGASHGLAATTASGWASTQHPRPPSRSCSLAAPTLCFQGSGLSDGSYVTLGALEIDDLAAAVQYLREEGARSLQA